ncbi:MAG TPA: phosphotransferase [Streptosporangiaceae bacterium]|nr:phosphotransferase [Streptosporangiaceae bacterium]
MPPPLLTLAGGDPVTPVWVNELGGITFAVGAGSGRRFVKWAPAGSRLDLAAEAARLRWAVRYIPVPVPLGEGSDPARWHPEHQYLDVPGALSLLADIPPDDRLVVCHGDSCAPNTLLTDDGRWSGHVDLGELGVAGRWADLAVATWSTTWNYGPGWETPLLHAYGVAPDPARTRYYRLLWDLGPLSLRPQPA